MRVVLCLWVTLCLASGIADATTFSPVALDHYANWNDYFVSLPTGDVSFDQIPFYLRQSNPAFITTGNWPYTPDWTGSIYSVYMPSNLGSLQSIEIRDLVPHPAIAVYGITVETVPEPSSIVALLHPIALESFLVHPCLHQDIEIGIIVDAYGFLP